MFQEYANYGVVRIESGNVRVYRSSGDYSTIYVGNATNASWAGSCLNVTLADGKVRRYRDFGDYTTIY